VPIGLCGLAQGQLGGGGDEGVQARFEVVETGQGGLSDLQGGEIGAAQPGEEVEQGEGLE
jgi:hypothetical protein